MSKRLIVFGGSGFVGRSICRQALLQGSDNCISFDVLFYRTLEDQFEDAWRNILRRDNSRGKPTEKGEEWMKEVEWVAADIFSPSDWSEKCKDADSVCVAVGAFGTNATMKRMCGEAPLQVLEKCHELQVPSFAFISAQTAPGLSAILRGYVEGKRMVEARTRQLYSDEKHLILRPGVVHTGVLQSLQSLLGGSVFTRMESVPLVGQGFIPPTSAHDIGDIVSSHVLYGRPHGTLTSRDIGSFSKLF